MGSYVKGMMLATFCLAAIAIQAGAADLITTPGHSDKTCEWRPFDLKPTKDAGKNGAQIFEFEGGPYGMNGSVVGISVLKPPVGRRLKFTLSLRTELVGQKFSIVMVSVDKKAKTALPWSAEWQFDGNLVAKKWTLIERTISLPTATDYLRIVVHNPNKEKVLMTAPHLIAGDAAEPDKLAIALAKKDIALVVEERKHPSDSAAQVLADKLGKQIGPVVAHLHLRAPVCTKKVGETAIVTFPVPAECIGQVPLAFKVDCQSPGKLVGFVWRKRLDGRNYVCEITVEPGTKGAWVEYEALVLLGGPNQRETTPTDEGWNKSTACVQAANPRIQAIEKKLAKPDESIESYARKVFEFVRDDPGMGEPFKQLDALAALDCGGSCTNKANLSAALLRAHGIPARTVAHMPTWATGKFYEHWLTEFWQPGRGWVALDPSLGRWNPDRRTRVILSVANPSDEDKAFDPLHERFVMPGAPYMSVAELSPTTFPADLSGDDAINSIEQVSLLDARGPAESALFAKATRAFGRMFARLAVGKLDQSSYARVFSAATTGKSQALLLSLN